MIPSMVVGVDRWPRTSSGKIDRRRLPAASLASSACAVGSVVGPRSASESAAREAIAGVLRLGAESVSVEASFFELGGNSLRAVALARRLSDVLGWVPTLGMCGGPEFGIIEASSCTGVGNYMYSAVVSPLFFA